MPLDLAHEFAKRRKLGDPNTATPTRDTPCCKCGQPLGGGGALQRADGSRWWCLWCCKGGKRISTEGA